MTNCQTNSNYSVKWTDNCSVFNTGNIVIFYKGPIVKPIQTTVWNGLTTALCFQYRKRRDILQRKNYNINFKPILSQNV